MVLLTLLSNSLAKTLSRARMPSSAAFQPGSKQTTLRASAGLSTTTRASYFWAISSVTATWMLRSTWDLRRKSLICSTTWLTTMIISRNRTLCLCDSIIAATRCSWIKSGTSLSMQTCRTSKRCSIATQSSAWPSAYTRPSLNKWVLSSFLLCTNTEPTSFLSWHSLKSTKISKTCSTTRLFSLTRLSRLLTGLSR